MHSRPVSEDDPEIAPDLIPLRDRLMQMVGLAWDMQPVPERIYAEARATRERRRTRKSVSVVEDVGTVGLELAEETD